MPDTLITIDQVTPVLESLPHTTHTQVWKRKGGFGRRVFIPNPTHPVTQRLFWLLRVVTSLFIGAVILGEYNPGQLPLSHLVPSAASLSSPCFLMASSASGEGGVGGL